MTRLAGGSFFVFSDLAENENCFCGELVVFKEFKQVHIYDIAPHA